MNWLLYDPFSFRVLFIGTGLLLFLLAFFLFRLTSDSKPVKKASAARARPMEPMATTAEELAEATSVTGPVAVPVPPATLHAEVSPSPTEVVSASPTPTAEPEPPPSPTAPLARPAEPLPATPALTERPAAAIMTETPFAAGYSFRTLQTRPSFALDLLRAGLIVASSLVFVAIVIVAVPESTIHALAARLQPAPTAATTDRLALLYLGDEAKDGLFRIRGVVRNISGDSLERIDATVRLYSHDSVLLETHIARLDIDQIPVDGAAQFQLVVPNYSGQIGSYAVEFRTRQEGDPVPFQDVRATQSQN
jgi:hypothetical protein